jgi:hypothetical protein
VPIKMENLRVDQHDVVMQPFCEYAIIHEELREQRDYQQHSVEINGEDYVVEKVVNLPFFDNIELL